MHSAPMHFQIAVRDFDVFLLPEDAREPGSKRFKTEVVRFFKRELEAHGGTAYVTVGDNLITADWSDGHSDPFETLDEYLQSGRLAEAVALMEVLIGLGQGTTGFHYNLGMALSDLGLLDEAISHLDKVVAKEPRNANAWVALGVAHTRKRDVARARESLNRAIEIEPNNPYAHRNLGALGMIEGEDAESEEHLRRAYESLPNDPKAQYGLAEALLSRGTEEALAEADQLYIKAISGPDPEIAELAKQSRSKIAATNFRKIGGSLRMDAVMYILGALQRFEGMSRDQIQAIGFEVAMLGQRGIDVNDPEQKYILRTLEGQYSGLHLMSLMYTAFQRLEPGMDVGFDLSAEYEAAKSLHKGER